LVRTALVVDDSVSIRNLVAYTLEQMEFQVIQGEDGADALAKLGQQAVQLVVTDLNMPKMDGIALIVELRKRPLYRFTPILMLTTESHPDQKQRGREAGATGWLVKPFDATKLQEVVAKVVR
jgi:two-component system chemotaxis response regulator CheY